MFSLMLSGFVGILGLSPLTAAAEIDPSWHGKCVGWVNKMRAKEGLPALQRWTDFERCADMTAMRDSKKDVEYWSYNKRLFCDWEPYAPSNQVTCHLEGEGEEAIETCVRHHWDEKKDLVLNSEGEIECKDQDKSIEECASGYLHMRGGHLGWNIYDRVTCGMYLRDDGHVWINLIYGRGEKVQANMLKKAEDWTYAPDGWDRKNFQEYGFACGGDKKTTPDQKTQLLPADCEASLDLSQYNDCKGEYAMDYSFHACGSQSPTSEPTAAPTNQPTEQPTAAPTNQPTAEPTQQPTAEPTEQPTAEPTNSPTAEPTNQPTAEPTEAPTGAPTPAPTLPNLPGAICAAVDNKNECKNTLNCIYGKKGPCRLLTESCESVTKKKNCVTANACKWDNGCVSRSESTPEPTAAPIVDPAEVCAAIGDDKATCKSTPNCYFSDKGPCQILSEPCSSIPGRKACNSANACTYSNNTCNDVTSENQ